ncbi:MAG TPA: Tn3 family transposase [Polaromonas sp.]|nr:Tn3 family transposase [Polaromonas sp.]
MTPTSASVIYPELPDPLTPGDLQQLFSPSFDERQWAPTVVRTAASQVAILVHLKIFQSIGRFRPAAEIPAILMEHVARRMGVEIELCQSFPERTRYRHRQAIFKRLGVVSWGPEALALTKATMRMTAQARTDPADIINSAIDALIRHDFELPALGTLRRLAGTAHSNVNVTQWKEVCGLLGAAQRAVLETLLVVDPKTMKSPFSNLCSTPGRPSRKNLNALVDRYLWLEKLPNPTTALQSVADSKISQWANEARRLNALELREYITPRRHTLLMAVIHDARGQVLDGLTQMLLRLARKVEWKSELRLTEWYQTRRNKTDTLIRAFRDSLIVHGSDVDPVQKVSRVETVFAAQGGHEALVRSCEEHLHHEKQNWRPFARAVFVPLRSALVRLVEILPLQGTTAAGGLLRLVESLTSEPSHSDHLTIDGAAPNTLPREWHDLVHDHASDKLAFNRRQLEVVVMLELATAIKAGEVFVTGSLSFDRFWDRLPSEAADSGAVAAYATARGWADGADGLVRAVKNALELKTRFLDNAVGSGQQAYLQRGKHGRPVVSRLRAVGTPETAIDLENQMMAHMPERAVLEAISNTEHWAQWGRHFGLPSRLGPQIKDASHRYVLTTFAYGCGLGPTEAARHLGGTVSADQLAFADRRHVDIADLRAASADLINLYAQFELPQQWGMGQSAAADGTHFETYEDNLLAEHHIRYGKTGGIAYRHVADNYIALFSRFIACGTYEATYILDALLQNLSDLQPRRVHADTHGQSAAVFGLAYLLGIELMPRIRRWQSLTLYRSDNSNRYTRINSLFSGTINWTLIHEHYPQFMQLALAILSGTLAPSAVLAKVNSYSTKNRFALALKELGNAVRTTYLLEWIMDESLRRTVHKGTTKVERHHKFAKHLAFGAGGHLRSNNPADQEKAIVYNELVTNAVALQNVVDQTQALHTLKSNGINVRTADLAFLSPYATSKLKRFGDYPTDLKPEAMPTCTALPL